MKKTLLHLTLAALLAIPVLIGCKKDKDDKLAVTKENLVGTYKLTAVSFTSAGQTKDIYNDRVDACAQDDLYKLEADGTFSYRDVGTQCEGGGYDYDAEWSIVGNNLTLEDDEFIIESITKTTVIATQTYTEQGVSITVKFTFTRQ